MMKAGKYNEQAFCRAWVYRIKRHMGKHTVSDLYQMQSLPLSAKIQMTERRIREWVEYYGIDGVYISFSGGKDSTVLMHIARKMYPGIPAVFSDTGLEYPEIREFVKQFDNVEVLRPKMNFRQVVEKYGYPFIGKEVAAVWVYSDGGVYRAYICSESGLALYSAPGMDVGCVPAAYCGFHMQQYALWSLERLYYTGYGRPGESVGAAHDVCKCQFYGDCHHCSPADPCVCKGRVGNGCKGVFLGSADRMPARNSDYGCLLLED